MAQHQRQPVADVTDALTEQVSRHAEQVHPRALEFRQPHASDMTAVSEVPRAVMRFPDAGWRDDSAHAQQGVIDPEASGLPEAEMALVVFRRSRAVADPLHLRVEAADRLEGVAPE